MLVSWCLDLSLKCELSSFYAVVLLVDYNFFGPILIIPDPASIAANQAGKEEVDARSVFVGNVRYDYVFASWFLIS